MIRTAKGQPIPLPEFLSMLQLYAHVLCTFVRDLSHYEVTARGLQLEHQNTLVDGADRELLTPILQGCDGVTNFLYMPATAARKERLEAVLSAGCVYSELGVQLRILRETMEDELRNILVLYMPPSQSIHFFADARLLGDAVIARFPGLGTDIDEAGKCLGSGRYTAAVFHLMRVLEVGVQEFGKALGVSLLDSRNVEKNWHNILEEVDNVIKNLGKGDPRRPALAEASASLSAVKLAWRNEVMHPKASYLDTEAENILVATRAFMGQLAELVNVSSSSAVSLASPISVP